MPRCHAVLFDLFDTLCRVDEPTYHEGKAGEAALLGVAPGPFLAAWIASSDDAQVGRLADIPARVRAAAGLLGLPEPEPDIVARVARIEFSTLCRATSVHPDALPVLESLRARPGLRLGLVSNATSAAEPLLAHLGLARMFDAASWSFRVGVAKPHPAIYLDACRALDVTPAGCVFVGDGNCRELDGARDLGMRAIRIERTFSLGPYRKEESRTFDASISDLRDLPALIET